MNRAPQMLRLTPQAAGALQQQCTKATTELLELTRFRKEFDRQLVALIGSASGLDTPEKNSLCCGAAGIIAPLGVTAEALIPHEKLREAATPDATLIAQIRQPAQLVIDHVERDRELHSLMLLSPRANVFQYTTEGAQTFFHLGKMRFQGLDIFLPKHPTVPIRILQNPTGATNTLKCYQNRFENLFIGRLVHHKQQGLMDTFYPPKTGRDIICLMISTSRIQKSISCILNNPFRKAYSFAFNAQLSIPNSSLLQLMSACGNQKSPNNCTYRAHSLHPSRSIIRRPLPKQEHHSTTDDKCSYWGSSNFEQSIGFKSNFIGKHLRLQATKKPSIVANCRSTVHEGLRIGKNKTSIELNNQARQEAA